MKVWAMPVGQAVTPTMIGFSTFWVAVVTAAATGAAAGAGCTTAVSSATISSGDFAARSEARKSFLISARANWVSSFRWSASPSAAAAIRKTRSDGPSLAPKSTGRDSRAKASEAWETAAERQCGMAKPPGRPVAALPSRSMASAVRPAASARPASATNWASDAMTASLVAPRSASSATRSLVMSCIWAFLFVGEGWWSGDTGDGHLIGVHDFGMGQRGAG